MNRGSIWASTRCLSTRLSFNEAPIHESGKCGEEPADEGQNIYASMRPRFMNRGSGVVFALDLDQAVELQ